MSDRAKKNGKLVKAWDKIGQNVYLFIHSYKFFNQLSRGVIVPA